VPPLTSPSLVLQQSLLQTVLKYHVVPGSALRAAQLKSEQRLTTLQGSNLTIRLEGSNVRVIGVSSRATVTTADVPACKAVVHVVDTVLLPQPLGP
jgi:transforming growth factor-beta-induced protein